MKGGRGRGEGPGEGGGGGASDSVADCGLQGWHRAWEGRQLCCSLREVVDAAHGNASSGIYKQQAQGIVDRTVLVSSGCSIEPTQSGLP